MKFKKFIAVASLSLLSFAKEGEDLEAVTSLIASTERQLPLLRELQALMVSFQEEQDLFHKGPQTKELASQMITTATKILKMAEDHHYLHLFSPFYIEELKLFSGIGKKKS